MMAPVVPDVQQYETIVERVAERKLTRLIARYTDDIQDGWRVAAMTRVVSPLGLAQYEVMFRRPAR